MELDTVEMLEEKIEKAIAATILKMGLKKLPLLPTPYTMHLMAKTASLLDRWRRDVQRGHD
jgi:hypothetical protein